MEAAEQRRIKARATWVEVFKETKSVSRTSRKCGVPRSTIYRWLKRYYAGGEDALRGQSRCPKKLAKQKITQDIEKQILDAREKHKWGPLRIHLHFKQIKGPNLSVPTIWRVLRRNNVKSVKKYRRHKDFKRYSRPVPGDRVQIDVTKITTGYFQYTAIDDCTRLKYARLYPSKSAQFSIEFLKDLIDYFGEIGFSIQRIQTDCGSEFYAQSLQEEMMEHHIKFRPNPPGKPHLNGKVERTQKTDKEEFYRTLSLKDKNLNLRRELAAWIEFYNYHRPHSALAGKTPYERFTELKDTVPIFPEIAQNWYTSKEKIKNLDWENYKRRNPERAKLMEDRLSQKS